MPLIFVQRIHSSQQDDQHTRIVREFHPWASFLFRRRNEHRYTSSHVDVSNCSHNPPRKIFLPSSTPNYNFHQQQVRRRIFHHRTSTAMTFSAVTPSPKRTAPKRTPKKPPKDLLPSHKKRRYHWQTEDKPLSQYTVEQMLQQLGMEPEDWTRLQRDVHILSHGPAYK